MRIGVISYHTSPLALPGSGNAGGMNVSIYNLYQNLARFCEIDIFSYGKEGCVRVNRTIRVIFLNCRKPTDFAAGILDYHAQDPYDLIHTHYWLSGLVGLRIKRSNNLPWVHTFHTIERFKGQRPDQVRVKVEDDIIRHCDLIISPTSKEQWKIKEIFPKTRVIVLPHGVDIRRFVPGPNGHSNILYVGRIDPIKGLDLLIDTVRRMKRDIKVKVVGGPSKDVEYLDSLKDSAKDLNIRFVGPVKQNLLCDYYLRAGMVIIPSYYESFGLVGLEAMAAARPVIGFEDTGLSETVGKDAGILVPRGVNHLTHAINLLIDNRELRHALGRKGRQKAVQFSWAKISKGYLKTYGNITEG